MNDSSNKTDFSSAISDIEALQGFVKDLKSVLESEKTDNLQEELFQLSLNISSVNFSELIELLSLQNESSVNRIEPSPRSESQLEELKAELKRREGKIQEFKLSLADSVIDAKRLQKCNDELQETTAKLRADVTQLQLHSKDQSMRLSSTEKNLQETQSSLASANEELLELRSQSYNLKSRCADYEDQIKEFQHRISAFSEELTLKKREVEKLKKLSGNLNESFELMRIEKEASEQRCLDLEKTIDVLQKEKNRLQDKLEKMLTGLPKTVSHAVPAGSNLASSILEPLSFTPFLPFCFPERIPALTVFKRQIQQSFAKEFPKRLPPPAPAFPQSYRIRIQLDQVRVFATRPKFFCEIPEHFAHPLTNPQISLANFSLKLELAMSQRCINFSEPRGEIFAASLNRRQRPQQRSSSLLAARKIHMGQNPEFGIHTHSLDLLLSYLSRTVIEGNYRELKHQILGLNHFISDEKQRAMESATNIFNEKLAFRYSYQLKSHKLNLEREIFSQSFKRSAGLKSVLETFGNTIDFMVRKYDVFSSPKAGKTG